jgi:acetyl esterase/lipase
MTTEPIIIRDLVYTSLPERKLALDLYLPAVQAGRPFPLVVWIHGGAWLMGDKAWCMAVPLTQQGFAVASLDYRLSQEAIFPAQLEDCKAAIRWLRAHASEYHLDPGRFGVWGDSAGGHLAALVGVTGGRPDLEGNVGGYWDQSSGVQAVCDWYGPSDFLHMHDDPGRSNHDAHDSPESLLIGGPIQEHPDWVARANPITYITPDAPPFLIMHGDQDDTVPLNQSILLAEALRQAGVPVTFEIVKGAGHGFKLEEHLPRVAAFFTRHLVAGK